MPPKKILIVDDEEDILKSLGRRLIADGYEVVATTSGQEAIQKIQEINFDLLIIDIVLPDIDGPEIILRIQRNPAKSGIPVIFFSGIISKGEQEYCSEVKVGGRDYPAIGKPFPYEELRKLIDQYL